jgi:SpoVK/Ycf46/Vps4 family AAA+-type ATPase
MLDGVEKLDNVVLIATTNYPKNSRPGHQPAVLGIRPLIAA